MIIIKNIYAKQDCVIATQVETRKFNKGDSGLVKFINEVEYDNLAALGLFIECITPPKTIQGGTSIPTSSVVPVIEAPVKVSNAIDAVPAVDDVLNEGPVVEAEKVRCVVCNTFMVLVTNAKEQEVMYCSQCDKEYPVAPPQEKTEEQLQDQAIEEGGEPEIEEKTKQVYFKCNCGKRKPANAELCKTCQAAANANADNPTGDDQNQDNTED